jgi:hypothetical protein
MPSLEEEYSPHSYYVNIFICIYDIFTNYDKYEEIVTLLRESPSYVRVFAVGFGDKVSVTMLKTLSRAGRGMYEKIASGHQDLSRLDHLIRCSTLPSENDISVEFPGQVLCNVPSYVPAIFAGHTQVFMGLCSIRPLSSDVTLNVSGSSSTLKVERTKKGKNFHKFVAGQEYFQVEKCETSQLFHQFSCVPIVSQEEIQKYRQDLAEKHELICAETIISAQQVQKSKKKVKGFPVIVTEFLEEKKSSQHVTSQNLFLAPQKPQEEEKNEGKMEQD